MRLNTVGARYLAIGLAIATGTAITPAREPSSDGRSSPLAARLTLADGTSRIVELEGVGCSASICSRTAIESRNESRRLVKTGFDALAGIQDTTSDQATLVMKDGGKQKISLLADFRVLYVKDARGGTARIDLSKINSVDFLAVSH